MSLAVGPLAPPLPTPSPESLPFWEACRGQELRLQRCRRCAQFWFPPSVLCQHCWSPDWSWDRLSGRGHVISFVVYRRVYHEAFHNQVPYVVAVIGLEEGVRFMSRLVEVDPAGVRLGMAVEVVFARVAEGVTLPLFRPVSDRQPGGP